VLSELSAPLYGAIPSDQANAQTTWIDSNIFCPGQLRPV